LGALPADVDALLQAYVGEVPSCQDLPREFKETVRLTRRALAPLPALPLPPLKLAPLVPRASRKRSPAWRLTELAAIFVLGLGLGSWLRPVSPNVEAKIESAVASHPTPPAAQVSDSARFWSVARMAKLESKTTTSGHSEISWNSPVRNPQLNP